MRHGWHASRIQALMPRQLPAETAMIIRSAIARLTLAATLLLLATANGAIAQDKVIRIGGLFPMSGPGAYFGAQDKQGIELAIEQINKSGVNGYKFEIRYED